MESWRAWEARRQRGWMGVVGSGWGGPDGFKPSWLSSEYPPPESFALGRSFPAPMLVLIPRKGPSLLAASCPCSVDSEGGSRLLEEDSEVYKMLQENREVRLAPRQSSSFRLLQEALEAEERGEPLGGLHVGSRF